MHNNLDLDKELLKNEIIEIIDILDKDKEIYNLAILEHKYNITQKNMIKVNK